MRMTGTRRAAAIDLYLDQWIKHRCKLTPASADHLHKHRVKASVQCLWDDWFAWLRSLPPESRPHPGLLHSGVALAHALQRRGFARPYRSNGNRYQLGIRPLADGETMIDPNRWSEIV